MLPRPGDHEATVAVFESSANCYYQSNHPFWAPVAFPSKLLALVHRTSTLAMAFSFKRARWNEFWVFVNNCLLSLIEGRGVYAALLPSLESGQGLLPSLALFLAGSPPLSCAWARFHGHPAPGPVVRLVVPRYIMINLCHRGAHSYGFRALGFRGPLASSLSSSGTSTPFGSAAPSLRLQLVLVFSQLIILLEACHHAHAWWACQLSGLLLSGVSCLLLYRDLRALGSQSPLLLSRLQKSCFSCPDQL